jgi:hypothetical protein
LKEVNMGRSVSGFFFGAAALLAASACGDGASAPGPLTSPDGPGPDEPGPNVPGDNISDDGIVDPTGVWWTEIETTGDQNLPTVGLLEGSKIRFVMRVEIKGEVPNQTAKFEFCKLQTEWENPLLPGDFHTIGFRPAATAAFGETLSVDFSGLSVGSAVPVPDLKFIAGGDATGAILDEDGDGYPAITTWVRVILPFEVAEVITIDANLDVEATDEDTLSGTLGFEVAADIIESSSAVFVPDEVPVTIVPDSNAVPITVKRLPGGGDCSAVPSTIKFTDVAPPGVAPIDPILGPQAPP